MRTGLYEAHLARLSPERRAADEAALLASEGARFITGQTIAVDGGASTR